jgi:hypothetical protein
LTGESQTLQNPGFQKIRDLSHIFGEKKMMFKLSPVAFGKGFQDVL